MTVLSGKLHFGHGKEFDRTKTKALEPGAVAIMAPGEPMFGYTEEETVIQLHGNGLWGIEYLDPADAHAGDRTLTPSRKPPKNRLQSTSATT